MQWTRFFNSMAGCYVQKMKDSYSVAELFTANFLIFSQNFITLKLKMCFYAFYRSTTIGYKMPIIMKL